MSKMQEAALKGFVVALAGALVTKGLVSSDDAAVWIPVVTAAIGFAASVFVRSGLPPKK